jgi:hypothetical protein
MTKAMQCGAKTRTGQPCKTPAMPNGRCRMHGGKHPGGVAAARFKDGRHSKYLPARLSSKYAEAMADSALLELRAEVALVDARLADVLSRVDTGESGALWASLMDARGELIQAKRSGDTVSQAKLINQILDLISRGHTDYRAWSEVGSLLEARRKLVESERKRQIEMQQTITAEKAMLLIGAILGVIRDNVTDRKQLNAISTAIVGLAALEAGE